MRAKRGYSNRGGPRGAWREVHRSYVHCWRREARPLQSTVRDAKAKAKTDAPLMCTLRTVRKRFRTPHLHRRRGERVTLGIAPLTRRVPLRLRQHPHRAPQKHLAVVVDGFRRVLLLSELLCTTEEGRGRVRRRGRGRRLSQQPTSRGQDRTEDRRPTRRLGALTRILAEMGRTLPAKPVE